MYSTTFQLFEIMETHRTCECGGTIEHSSEDGDHEYWADSWDICNRCRKSYKNLPIRPSGRWGCEVEDNYGNVVVTATGNSREDARANAERKLARYEENEYAGDE